MSTRPLLLTSERDEPLRAPVRVGKDILGLLSSAMYAEPLAIVREYVQNAADSIDVAYESGLLSPKNPGRIDLLADAEARTLVIRDNGVGIARERAEDVLVAFGLSRKRGTGARGFRGVGRLGGLGFAQQVAFRTRFAGEPKVTEVGWDCRALKAILLDSQEGSGLEDVVRRIVTVRHTSDRRAPDHFFEVELSGVVRLRADRLLNPAVVDEYIAQVAPLPLSPDLRFTPEITEFIQQFVPRRRIEVRLNGSEPLVRPHRNTFAVSGSKRDRFGELELLKLGGVDGRVAAVGWVLHHGYLGALKATPDIRGLRARVGDMQIGDEGLFSSIFPEPRFNSWVVGELHILDSTLVPNGRRDGFEQNAGYLHLVNQLGPIGRQLAQRCRSTSQERSRLRTFERTEALVMSLARQIRSRRVTGRRARAAVAEAHEALADMAKLIPKCSTKKATLDELARRLRGWQSVVGKSSVVAKDATDPLALLPAGRRAAYEDFTRALYACSASRRSAELLAARILRWLMRQHHRNSGPSKGVTAPGS